MRSLAILALLAISGLMSVLDTSPAFADDWDSCNQPSSWPSDWGSGGGN